MGSFNPSESIPTIDRPSSPMGINALSPSSDAVFTSYNRKSPNFGSPIGSPIVSPIGTHFPIHSNNIHFGTTNSSTLMGSPQVGGTSTANAPPHPFIRQTSTESTTDTTRRSYERDNSLSFNASFSVQTWGSDIAQLGQMNSLTEFGGLGFTPSFDATSSDHSYQNSSASFSNIHSNNMSSIPSYASSWDKDEIAITPDNTTISRSSLLSVKAPPPSPSTPNQIHQYSSGVQNPHSLFLGSNLNSSKVVGNVSSKGSLSPRGPPISLSEKPAPLTRAGSAGGVLVTTRRPSKSPNGQNQSDTWTFHSPRSIPGDFETTVSTQEDWLDQFGGMEMEPSGMSSNVSNIPPVSYSPTLSSNSSIKSHYGVIGNTSSLSSHHASRLANQHRSSSLGSTTSPVAIFTTNPIVGSSPTSIPNLSFAGNNSSNLSNGSIGSGIGSNSHAMNSPLLSSNLPPINLNQAPSSSYTIKHSSRILLLQNVDSSANLDSNAIRSLFTMSGGAVRSLTHLPESNAYLIAFFDLRHAQKAMTTLHGKMLGHHQIDLQYHFLRDTGGPVSKESNQGTLVIFNLEPSITNTELMETFGKHGEIKEIRESPNRKHKFIEFYDVRCAEKAIKALNKTDLHGRKIKIEPSRPGGNSKPEAARRGSAGPMPTPSTLLHASNVFTQSSPSLPSINDYALNSPHGNSLLLTSLTSFPPQQSHSSQAPSLSLNTHSQSSSPSPFVGSPVAHHQTATVVPFGLTGALSPRTSSPHRFALGTNTSSSQYSQMQSYGNYDFGIGAQNSPGNLNSNAASYEPSFASSHVSSFGEYTPSNSISSIGMFPAASAAAASNQISYVSQQQHQQTSQLLQHRRSPPTMLSDVSALPTTAVIHSNPPSSFEFVESNSIFYNQAPATTNSLFTGASSTASLLFLGAVDGLHQESGSPPIDDSPRAFPLDEGRDDHSTSSSDFGSDDSTSSTEKSSMVARTYKSNEVSTANAVNTANKRGGESSPPGVHTSHHVGSSADNSINTSTSASSTWSGDASANSSAGNQSSTPPQQSHQAKFDIIIPHVLGGSDIRTTLMIKNIPNKYDQEMLLLAVNKHHLGMFDFFYLPIDFKNRCNVGYAFINFIDPRNIPAFYEEFNNKKWEKFNSEKVCKISYARIQGKNAMIEHFKNSSLMFEDPKCRPLLFYSDGTAIGKPESFPVGPNVRPRSRKDSTGNSSGGNHSSSSPSPSPSVLSNPVSNSTNTVGSATTAGTSAEAPAAPSSSPKYPRSSKVKRERNSSISSGTSSSSHSNANHGEGN